MTTNTLSDRMCAPGSWNGRGNADPYTARQASLLRDTLARHAALLGDMLRSVSQCSSEPMRPNEIQLFEDLSLDERIDDAKNTSEKVLQTELKKARVLGPIRRLASRPSAKALQALIQDFPHCADIIDLMSQRAALATMSPGMVFSLPPILLSGPPGVGKTAFSEAIAKCLGVPTRRIDVGAATAGFVIAGSHSSWSGARHGVIWSLLQSSTASGLVLLDELDKAGSSNFPILGPLLTLLEPSSAKMFTDEYIDLPVDASHLIWVATCNDLDAIQPALRSRFAVFEVPAPTAAQMTAVAHSVYRGIRARASWGAAFPKQLDPVVAEEFAPYTPRELHQLIESAAAHAAANRQSHIRVADVRAAQDGLASRVRAKPRAGFI
jgi:ATP-dependent Lon protease